MPSTHPWLTGVRRFLAEQLPAPAGEPFGTAVRLANPPPYLHSTLCGIDDPVGKSGDTDADFERMGYASKACYGSTEMALSQQ